MQRLLQRIATGPMDEVARTGEGILHTRSATDIVKAELSNTGVLLEQERKRLANTTGSTENSNLGKLLGRMSC